MTRPQTNPEGLPKALVPPYPIAGLNPVVNLYAGNVRLQQGEKELVGDGIVDLRWGQGAEVHFEVTADIDSPTFDLGAEASVELVGLNATGKIWLAQWSDRHTHSGAERFVSGQIQVIEMGHGPVTSVDFVIVNLPPYLGAGVERKGGFDSARMSLTHDVWTVVIDQLADAQIMFGLLKAQSGFGVLHTGRLSRADGAAFDTYEAKQILDGLSVFLGFVAGDWSAVLLPVGRNTGGEVTWQRWAPPICRPWAGRFSWLSKLAALDLSTPFSGFLKRYLAPTPGEAIGHLIKLYVHANGHVLMEPRIVLAQAALELLAWLHSAENPGRRTKDPRQLLEDAMGPGLGVPSELPDLALYASQQAWDDGPTAIAQVRNGLVHPGARKNLFTSSSAARLQAWQLAMHYLETGLLFWLDYQGKLLTRLRSKAVWDLEDPPWNQYAS